ncbi:uncharacterized protein TRAVEDRAFT_37461 [Trametes versicolor FP-101664 SS1]|uniref:uncharacterized protein n=1 Tax=Trametes versicolor (strain FP-101664) TaxID=717944 RepID=UPI0004621C62|nr:uncharacterized protein TRAVEDRAFT_37461 [Trametes versicolor FP-101664 SS1]EIW58565.1 hypothetical protein TRAVEDRAFT_37461 [Trametes versicolor FP-101664 SS1]
MQQVLDRAARMLTSSGALDDPVNALRVFVVASDVDVPQAEEAARATLRAPLGKDLPYELDGISPASLYRLMEYRRRVHAAAVSYLTDTDRWTLAKDFDLDAGKFDYSKDTRYTRGGRRWDLLPARHVPRRPSFFFRFVRAFLFVRAFFFVRAFLFV